MLLVGIAHGIILITYKQFWYESARARENNWSLQGVTQSFASAWHRQKPAKMADRMIGKIPTNPLPFLVAIVPVPGGGCRNHGENNFFIGCTKDINLQMQISRS